MMYVEFVSLLNPDANDDSSDSIKVL